MRMCTKSEQYRSVNEATPKAKHLTTERGDKGESQNDRQLVEAHPFFTLVKLAKFLFQGLLSGDLLEVVESSADANYDENAENGPALPATSR